MNEVIYTGWDTLKLAPDLSVEMDPQSRFFGWLMVRVPDERTHEHWVTLADLKPLAARICANKA